MQRRAFKEINRYNRSIVNDDTGAYCGFQGNNSTQCWAKRQSLSSRQLTTRASSTSCWEWRELGACRGEKEGREMKTWQSAWEITSSQELNVGGLINSLNKTEWSINYWFEDDFALLTGKKNWIFVHRFILYFTPHNHTNKKMLVFLPADKRQCWMHKIWQKDWRVKRLTRGGRWTWREAAGSPSKCLPTHAWQKTRKTNVSF